MDFSLKPSGHPCRTCPRHPHRRTRQVARWRRWVYFDTSGGEMIERHAAERGLIGREIPLEKLMFGSDCQADDIHEHVERFVDIFDELRLTDEGKELMWYRNAAELFGLEQPSWSEE